MMNPGQHPNGDVRPYDQGPQNGVLRKFTGVVRWFSMNRGVGYIIRDDTQTDIFVERSAISRKNPDKVEASLDDGERVEFNIVENWKTLRAINVTGPEGAPVRGSPFSSNRNYYHSSTTVHYMS